MPRISRVVRSVLLGERSPDRMALPTVLIQSFSYSSAQRRQSL
jgi:hypothetical protein